ncbi:MAG TPA: hypothetical protein VHX17_00435 [Candidatus Cybelea sp.]|jgi:hypothetical protein|nr:hypothetical protein [Candidatus Cybelea sp.]
MPVLTAIIEISDRYEGDAEPQRAATLVVDALGFHDPQGLGKGGQESAVLSLADVNQRLLQVFTAEEIAAVLDQVLRLRFALGVVSNSPPV